MFHFPGVERLQTRPPSVCRSPPASPGERQRLQHISLVFQELTQQERREDGVTRMMASSNQLANEFTKQPSNRPANPIQNPNPNPTKKTKTYKTNLILAQCNLCQPHSTTYSRRPSILGSMTPLRWSDDEWSVPLQSCSPPGNCQVNRGSSYSTDQARVQACRTSKIITVSGVSVFF